MSRLLTTDPPEYREHFHPFPADEESVGSVLGAATRDAYWGVWSAESLLGLVMLRGLDAGFSAPAFGVYVARAASGSGIATLALVFAEAWCRLNGHAEVMLTVHPDNASARRLYEAKGYHFTGEQSASGHRIYRKPLSDPA